MGSGGHTPKWDLIRWHFRGLLCGSCSSAHGLGPAGAYVGSAYHIDLQITGID